MRKVWRAGVLALVLTLSLGLGALAAGVENFQMTQPDRDFSDVGSEYWFSSWVHEAVQLGLVKGKSDTEYCPDDAISLAEVITLAARLCSTYHGGASEDLTAGPGEAWWQPYVDFCGTAGILEGLDIAWELEHGAADRPASRLETAMLLGRVFDAEGYPERNEIPEIPDVSEGDLGGREVYRLYRAGITQGKDAYGSFGPADSLRRSEAAAMVVRLAVPERRLDFVLRGWPVVSGRYEEHNDDAPGNWIEFNDADKTFTSRVNLYEGYGYVSGVYETVGKYESGLVNCTVTEVGFRGWTGDDVTSVDFIVSGDRIQVLEIRSASRPDGGAILCSIWPGAVFTA